MLPLAQGCLVGYPLASGLGEGLDTHPAIAAARKPAAPIRHLPPREGERRSMSSSSSTVTSPEAEAAAAAASPNGSEEATFSLALNQDQKDIRDWVHGF